METNPYEYSTKVPWVPHQLRHIQRPGRLSPGQYHHQPGYEYIVREFSEDIDDNYIFSK